MTFQKEMRMQIEDKKGEYSAGIIATVHKAGGGLNHNPHSHIISTRELINRKTGELSRIPFIPYKRFRMIWMNAVLRLLVKRKILTKEESLELKNKYKNGFHIYFKPINVIDNDLLFSTAEYLADGYFHNTQVVKVDHNRKLISFRYRNWINRRTGEKFYKIKTMDIYEFMARMLFFLPTPHLKTIRYYGYYAWEKRDKEHVFESKTWSKGIENSFEKKPEKCPRCNSVMSLSIIYSVKADIIMVYIWQTHWLYKGYFYPRSRSP